MQIIDSPAALQDIALRLRSTGSLSLVPTMGCLHEGHLALVRHAKELAPKVAVSIFVNPLQFAPGEDFDRYPRTFEEDCRKLEGEGVDLLFAPTVDKMYPPGMSTGVKVGPLQSPLCGKSRPGHFDGVATVCLKLFQASLADTAVFGEKDFQQLRILEQMVSDFSLPLRLIRHATVREADGLALSSRNRYLSAEEREVARQFARALAEGARSGLDSVGGVRNAVRSQTASLPLTWDYLEVAEENDLVPEEDSMLTCVLKKPRLFAAAKFGKTRLIDNHPLGISK